MSGEGFGGGFDGDISSYPQDQSNAYSSTLQTNKQEPYNTSYVEPEKKEGCCKRFWTHKCCHIFVVISVFIVAPLMIVVVGGFCSFFLFYFKAENLFASFLFCIYCFLFGILLFLVEFKIKVFASMFLFLLSYFYKAVFIIFLGTLTMSAYESIPKWSWVGYVTGGGVIVIGVLQIIIGCCDKTFVREQQSKMDSTASSYGWEAAPQISSSDFKQNQQNKAQVQKQQEQPQPQNRVETYNFDGPIESQSNVSEYNPNRGSFSTAATMPETRQLAVQGGMVAGGAYLQGASRQEAFSAAVNDPTTQRYAANAVIAGARNPQIQQAAVNTASTAFGAAYDNMFE